MYIIHPKDVGNPMIHILYEYEFLIGNLVSSSYLIFALCIRIGF